MGEKKIQVLLASIILLLSSYGWTATKSLINQLVDAEFSFRDESGKSFAFSEYQGQAVVLTMSYTECKKSCPFVTMAKLKEIQKKIESTNKKAEIIIVSFNPQSDTPEVLKKFKKRKSLDFSNWHFLTGSEEQTKKFAGFLELGDFYKMDSHIIHGYRIYLLKADGEVAQILDWDHGDVDWSKWLQ